MSSSNWASHEGTVFQYMLAAQQSANPSVQCQDLEFLSVPIKFESCVLEARDSRFCSDMQALRGP